jgi:hypothetical protein
MNAPSKAIDLGRVGLSKSLMVSPCERKGWFGEHVRDAEGRRLRFPMPERVTFGKAVDVAHGFIVWHETRGEPWTLEEAVAEGLKEAAQDADSWKLIDDPETFALQVATAMRLFLSSPDGLPRLRPFLDGIRIQGDDGRSLKADDIIGTPDYLLPDGSVLDVKTSGRVYGPDKFWQSPEMGIYALLVTAENGALPPKAIYQVYVRVAKPYWQWIETDGTADLVEIGRDAADHWREVIAFDSPTKVATNTMFCKDCPFAQALPEYGFEGCSVGRRMPREELAA